MGTRAEFTLAAGLGAFEMSRPLSVSTDLDHDYFLFSFLVTKIANKCVVILIMKMSHKNFRILFLLRGGPGPIAQVAPPSKPVVIGTPLKFTYVTHPPTYAYESSHLPFLF
jgi:hypothetical protein